MFVDRYDEDNKGYVSYHDFMEKIGAPVYAPGDQTGVSRAIINESFQTIDKHLQKQQARQEKITNNQASRSSWMSAETVHQQLKYVGVKQSNLFHSCIESLIVLFYLLFLSVMQTENKYVYLIVKMFTGKFKSPNKMLCVSLYRDKIRDSYPYFYSAFKKYDTRKRGCLSVQDIQQVLVDFNYFITDAEFFRLLDM